MTRRLIGMCLVALLSAIAQLKVARGIDYAWNVSSNGNWKDGGNWNPGGPPVAADNATIDLAGTYTVTLNDSRAITNLTLNNSTATLSHTAGTFTVGGTIALTSGTYSLNGGTISGGSITSAGGLLKLQGNNSNRLIDVAVGLGVLDFSTTNARVRLQGTTSLAAGTVIDLATPSSILVFEQTTTHNDLTINMTSGSSFLSVDGNNTLTLGPAATVTHSSTGSSTIQSDIISAGNAVLLNQGLIRNTNTGTLTINPDTFTNQSGGFVRASAGTITIGSGGSINAVGGTLDINGGTMNLNGAGWSNAGNITLSSGTLNLGGSFTTAGIGLANFTRTGGTVNITG